MAEPSSPARNWYQLFSRGARDWLRHNDKVREACVRLKAAQELLAQLDRLSIEPA